MQFLLNRGFWQVREQCPGCWLRYNLTHCCSVPVVYESEPLEGEGVMQILGNLEYNGLRDPKVTDKISQIE